MVSGEISLLDMFLVLMQVRSVMYFYEVGLASELYVANVGFIEISRITTTRSLLLYTLRGRHRGRHNDFIQVILNWRSLLGGDIISGHNEPGAMGQLLST